ncbi:MULTISPECIES: YqzE family protein [unclassified Sutcliffiella]|uniref:YqzE family protein n=1 Tax=unclassified Sutcliffiella TaxID=2837532 RepID=UPI0030D3D5AD
MKTNDYVKYVTQQLVTYMDQPKEVKREQRELKKQERSPIAFQLFGVLPYAIMMLFKKKKNGV